MYKASWVFLLAVSLMLTAGCKKDELQAKDARIAELEAQGQDTSASLQKCKEDRENLNKLVKGYTGEINAMEAALAEAAAREARAAQRLEEYRSMLKQLKSMIDAGKLSVRIVRNKMVVELPEAVLFASGSAKLKDEGVRVLAEVGPVRAHQDEALPLELGAFGRAGHRGDQAAHRVRLAGDARLRCGLRGHAARRDQRHPRGPRPEPAHRDRASAEPRRASGSFRPRIERIDRREAFLSGKGNHRERAGVPRASGTFSFALAKAAM